MVDERSLLGKRALEGLPVLVLIGDPGRRGAVALEILSPVHLLDAISLALELLGPFRFFGFPVPLLLLRRGTFSDLLQCWIFLHFRPDDIGQLEPGKLEQLDRLLKLRSHDELLHEF